MTEDWFDNAMKEAHKALQEEFKRAIVELGAFKEMRKPYRFEVRYRLHEGGHHKPNVEKLSYYQRRKLR